MVQGRLLRKTFGGFYVLDDGSAPVEVVGDGWKLTNEGSTNYVWRTDYFDLQGYVDQKKTVFIQTVDWQDFQNFYCVASQVWPIQRIQIISTEPVSESDLTKYTSFGGGGCLGISGYPRFSF